MPIFGVRRAPLLAAFFVAFALVLFFSTRADAQTINVAQEASLPRLDANGKQVNKRPLQLQPEGVSYQDCVDDLRIRFPLNLAGFEAQATLQLWAANTGTDCKPQTARSGISQQCWQIGGNIPLALTVDVIVPVREIMSGVQPAGPLPEKQIKDQRICGLVEFSTISLQFLYFKPAQQGTPAVHKDLSVQVDTIGPRPPSGIDVKPGNTNVLVTWAQISGDSGLTALTGVKVYCAPAQSTTTTTGEASFEDAGENCVQVPIDGADEAGDDAAIYEDGGCTPLPPKRVEPQSTTNNCASPEFLNSEGKPKIPDDAFNKRFECGSYTGNSGTSVRAEGVGGAPLQNGKSYAIAVAGTDQFGNVGELSSVICETPQETTDFWEAYKSAGGQGGGGFCTTSGPGLPTGSLTVLIVAGALVVSAVRRRSARAKGKGR